MPPFQDSLRRLTRNRSHGWSVRSTVRKPDPGDGQAGNSLAPLLISNIRPAIGAGSVDHGGQRVVDVVAVDLDVDSGRLYLPVERGVIVLAEG